MIDLPVPEVLAAARAAGLVRVVTVGTDLESSRWSARCATEHDAVYAAVAIHPNETQAVSAEVGTGAPAPGSPAADEVLAVIEELAAGPGGVPLLLWRRGHGQAVRRGRLCNVVRRQRHLSQRAAAPRRRRGRPA